MKRLTLTFVLFLLLPALLLAQATYKFSDQSTLTLSGTSTMHDWSMQAKGLQGEAQLDVASGKLINIAKLHVTLPAENLKSGKAAMDKNAYDALKTNKFATIKFRLSNLSSIEQKGQETLITVSGILTIAGVDRPEKIEAQCHLNPDGSMLIKGSKQLVMSQYGITPPSFMFGSVTTGDKVTISFTTILQPAQPQLLQ